MCVLVAFVHHRVRAAPAERGEALFRGFDQQPADALPAAIGCDREPVEVAAPAVEPCDDGANDPPVALGGEAAFDGARATGYLFIGSGDAALCAV